MTWQENIIVLRILFQVIVQIYDNDSDTEINDKDTNSCLSFWS